MTGLRLKRPLGGLSLNQLKAVAVAAMVIDHIAAPNMGGEDFAYYLMKKPGAFMFLSSANHEKNTDVPHHNPHFNVDEDVLWEGSAVFVNIVDKFLNK